MPTMDQRPLAGFEDDRRRMVEDQLARRDIHDPRILDAMRTIPRELFVPVALQHEAYADQALPIDQGQTISQPLVVAEMLQDAAVAPGDRLLDVGTGSGYAAAVASRLVARVFSIERLPALAETARLRLAALGIDNVEVCTGDGSLGWPEQGPFDVILVAAAAPAVPMALRGQLADGGRLVIPVGDLGIRGQRLVVVRRRGDQFDQRAGAAVSFVPLVGAQGWPTGRGGVHHDR
ncbi:MAG: protein-L-isoaspartate(D-aspartate) O-methyltransferase [Azospirillaceae bacterium]|nr:protein-L-isoaspartate(D-aspartate) O-methyltransferase [Azospirillaceae bacterium]